MRKQRKRGTDMDTFGVKALESDEGWIKNRRYNKCISTNIGGITLEVPTTA